jgi:hypothetical protein
MHVLRTYLNIFKIIIKPKSIGKCATWFSSFCKSNDFCLQKKNSDQIFPFHIYFSQLCKISNQREKTRRDKCIWMFSITLSHFEKITWIFAYMIGAITNFWESIFIFSFVSYGLVTKSLGARCTFEEVPKKT